MEVIATERVEQEFFSYWRERMRAMAHRTLEARLAPKLATSDLLQDMVTYVWEHLDAFRGKTDVEMEAWLKKVVTGLAANLSRHYHTKKRDVKRETALARAARACSGSEGIAEKAVEQGELAIAVDSLGENQRAIVLMYIFEHRTFKEIAARLGRSESAVRQTYSKGLDSIRRFLDGQPD